MKTIKDYITKVQRQIDKQPNGCWNWTGYIDKEGYGKMSFLNYPTRVIRFVAKYIMLKDIEGVQVNHKCHNRKCTNPEHLYVGTHDDNMDDRKAIGNYADMEGQNNPHAKLQNAQVQELRVMSSLLPLDFLSKYYGISLSTIQRIKSHRLWKDLKPPTDAEILQIKNKFSTIFHDV